MAPEFVTIYVYSLRSPLESAVRISIPVKVSVVCHPLNLLVLARNERNMVSIRCSDFFHKMTRHLIICHRVIDIAVKIL